MLTALSKLSGVSRKSLFEAIFTIGGRIFSVFLVIATTKFLTTFLSEAEYGQLALYNITATLPSTFFFGPVGQGILRFYPIAKEKSHLGAFHHAYNKLHSYGARATLAAGCLAALTCWFAGNLNWAAASILIAVASIVYSRNTYRYGLQNAARKRTLALGLETGERVLQQVLAVALLWFLTGNPLIVLAGYLAASALFSFINGYYYPKSFPEIFDPAATASAAPHQPAYTRDILKYSWPFILFGVFFWVQNASERWTLEFLCDTEMVGRYAVLNQIGFQSLNLLFGSISYFLFPILFNRAGSLQNSGQFEHADRLNRWYLWFNAGLTLTLVLVFWAFGVEVIRLLSSEKYTEVAWLLPLMALAGGLFNFAQNYANRFTLSMQTHLLIYPKIGASVIGVPMNILFIKYFNLHGLVLAVVLTQAIYVTLLIVVWQIKGKAGVSHYSNTGQDSLQ